MAGSGFTERILLAFGDRVRPTFGRSKNRSLTRLARTFLRHSPDLRNLLESLRADALLAEANSQRWDDPARLSG